MGDSGGSLSPNVVHMMTIDHRTDPHPRGDRHTHPLQTEDSSNLPLLVMWSHQEEELIRSLQEHCLQKAEFHEDEARRYEKLLQWSQYPSALLKGGAGLLVLVAESRDSSLFDFKWTQSLLSAILLGSSVWDVLIKRSRLQQNLHHHNQTTSRYLTLYRRTEEQLYRDPEKRGRADMLILKVKLELNFIADTDGLGPASDPLEFHLQRVERSLLQSGGSSGSASVTSDQIATTVAQGYAGSSPTSTDSPPPPGRFEERSRSREHLAAEMAAFHASHRKRKREARASPKGFPPPAKRDTPEASGPTKWHGLIRAVISKLPTTAPAAAVAPPTEPSRDMEMGAVPRSPIIAGKFVAVTKRLDETPPAVPSYAREPSVDNIIHDLLVLSSEAEESDGSESERLAGCPPPLSIEVLPIVDHALPVRLERSQSSDRPADEVDCSRRRRTNRLESLSDSEVENLRQATGSWSQNELPRSHSRVGAADQQRKLQQIMMRDDTLGSATVPVAVPSRAAAANSSRRVRRTFSRKALLAVGSRSERRTLAIWMHRVRMQGASHAEVAGGLERQDKMLSYPAVVIDAVLAFLLASLHELQDEWLTVSIVLVVSAISQALREGLQFGARARVHRNASIEYAKLCQSIVEHVAKPQSQSEYENSASFAQLMLRIFGTVQHLDSQFLLGSDDTALSVAKLYRWTPP